VAKEERRRKSAGGEGRTHGGCPLTPVRLSSRLLVEEKGLCGFPTAEDAVEREKKMCRNRKKAGFLAHFGPDFLLPPTIKSISIYRQWKRAILSIVEKNFNP
jgi:hypothetical protein